MMAMTRTGESHGPSDCLLLAFELGQRAWKIGFTVGMGQRPRLCQIPAGAVSVLENQLARAKRRFGLPAGAPVVSCYGGGTRWLLATPVSARAGDHKPRGGFIEH
jgi:hypothetical protein